jgi:hypothetical protein
MSMLKRFWMIVSAAWALLCLWGDADRDERSGTGRLSRARAVRAQLPFRAGGALCSDGLSSAARARRTLSRAMSRPDSNLPATRKSFTPVGGWEELENGELLKEAEAAGVPKCRL